MFESCEPTGGEPAALLTVYGDEVERCREPFWGPPTAEEVALVKALDAAAAADRPDESWSNPGDPTSLAWDAFEQFRAPTADYLANHETGAPLAFALEEADPTAVDDYTVVELVAAWNRLTAWAQAGATRAAAELAGRESMIVPESRPLPTHGRRRRPSLSSAAAHEIAMRLVISRNAAQALIDVGLCITGPMTAVGDALADGLIDLPRARAFVDGLAGAPLPIALDVQDAVLPGAPRRTVKQVNADIAKALISTDQPEATRRHRAARDRRRVCRPTPLPDGMAGIWSVLPAPDAVALDIALDAAARTASNAGDERTHDQLRADVLASVGHAALATGSFGAAPEPTFRIGEIGGRPAEIRVTVPLAVLLPPPEPATAEEAGGQCGDNGAAGGCREGGQRGDRGQDGEGGQRGDRSENGEGGPDAFRDPNTRSHPNDGEVAELEGYGPITPEVARALALGGRWRRLVTDPESGAVRDVGRTRYKPPVELAELVRARDRTCVRPGCGARAQGCDLDHTVPYHLGGHTAEGNLGALCPTDHALKTAGGCTVTQVSSGVFDFEMPSGHVYRREADGTSTLRPKPRDDGPPPF